MAPVVDSLQKSLTQTILVNLVNGNNGNSNHGIEMPLIASLAPSNTSLHLEKGKTVQNQAKNPFETFLKDENILSEPADVLPGPPSPAKSEISSTTETESLKSSTITDHGSSPPGLDVNNSGTYCNKHFCFSEDTEIIQK